jgi:hypothetical protein
MRITKSEDYEEIGAEFQYQIIRLLNSKLKEHNLSKENRKKICGDFIFDFSMLLDASNIEVENEVYQPQMAFSKEEKLMVANDEFSYHEYAFGNLDELFDSE